MTTRVDATLLRRVARHLPVLLLGRPLHGAERYAPFFIVGSGRCGTTLLRAMLEAHPDVHIPPECHAFRMAVRDYRRYARLPWSVVLRVVLSHYEFAGNWYTFDLPLGPLFRELCGASPRGRNLAAVLDALYRAHAARLKPGATRWGDKTPLNTYALRELRAVFPDLRVIHMVRDGRDVVGSYFGLTHYDPTFYAQQWIKAVRTAQAFGARYPAHYLEVRYEDLVLRPRLILEGVTAFLGLTFDERMLRHHELDLRLGDVDRIPHFQGARQAIHNGAVGRWRKDFNASQIAEVERLLGPTLATLGYARTADSV